MKWYLNDLSIDGSCTDYEQVIRPVQQLFSEMTTSRTLRDNLFCSKSISHRPALGKNSFGSVINRYASADEKRLILNWLGKRGPFIEDDRLSDQDDYFEFEDEDVTDLGLGEAARRIKASEAAGTFSLFGDRNRFSAASLIVRHGLSENPLGWYDVTNEHEPARLRERADNEFRTPRDWNELLDWCRDSLHHVYVSPYVDEIIKRETFYPVVASRSVVLLNVLNDYVASRNSDGTDSERSTEIKTNHFMGDKAWFSDESTSNKAEFKTEMTFYDDAISNSVTCYWHGKIKTPQFRIHFEWPLAPASKAVRVHYIGPKIAKR